MVRLLIALFTCTLLLVGTSDAQWFSGKRLSGLFGKQDAPSRHGKPSAVPNQYRTPYPTTTGRMSVGVFSYPDYNYPAPGAFDPYRFDNYVYRPFAYGHFREPDLLNDPYFRERHRYDSHFPGRRKPQLQMQSAPRALAYPTPRNPHLYHGDQHSLRAKPPVSSAHDTGPSQLANSLAGRQDGEAWVEFLAPEQIERVLSEGNVDQINEMLSRYDGVAQNSDLRAISNLPGFQATRELLRQQASIQAAPEEIEFEPQLDKLSEPVQI